MKDFCHRCGRELNGTEDRCPECGSPIGSNGVAAPSAPNKRDYAPNDRRSPVMNPRTIAIVSLILICVVGMMLYPLLTKTDGSDKYSVDVTVEQISVLDSSTDHVYGSSIPTQIQISLGKDMSNSKTLGKWDGCPTNGTTYTPADKNQTSFEYSGDLKNLAFYVFFNAITKMDGDVIKNLDDIDVYDETEKITGTIPKYIGCSGVTFTYEEVHDGYITLKGDSDPIGTVKLKINVVKM